MFQLRSDLLNQFIAVIIFDVFVFVLLPLDSQFGIFQIIFRIFGGFYEGIPGEISERIRVRLSENTPQEIKQFL